jgi:ubiquinone/menaquinone biosynthesis C-methylase UbiE
MISSNTIPVLTAEVERKPYMHAMPDYSVDGMEILDVGCATGGHFTHPHYAKAEGLYGIDVDEEAVKIGTARYPRMHLSVGRAEKLPYHGDKFDLVISRVSLPLTDLPRALNETYRVLKSGGRIYLAMHDVHHQLYWLKTSIKAGAIKRVLDICYYVFPASWLYNFTGVCIGRPWSGTFETFQTEKRMRKALDAVGFKRVTFKYINRYGGDNAKNIDRHLIFEAVKFPRVRGWS